MIGFAAFGYLCAVLTSVAQLRRTRRAWIARQPKLYAEWASIPLHVRRRIRRGLRRGHPPPAEYAALVLGLVEEIDGLWKEVPSANRRQARQTAPILGLGLGAGAFLLSLAHPEGQAIGVIVEGYTVPLTLVTLRSVWVRPRAAKRRLQAVAAARAAVESQTGV